MHYQPLCNHTLHKHNKAWFPTLNKPSIYKSDVRVCSLCLEKYLLLSWLLSGNLSWMRTLITDSSTHSSTRLCSPPASPLAWALLRHSPRPGLVQRGTSPHIFSEITVGPRMDGRWPNEHNARSSITFMIKKKKRAEWMYFLNHLLIDWCVCVYWSIGRNRKSNFLRQTGSLASTPDSNALCFDRMMMSVGNNLLLQYDLSDTI